MEKKTVYVLLGPTGSGKTDFVRSLNPDVYEIISCDSRQVYREMPVGTAVPDQEVKDKIRHHLIECIRPDESMDSSMYAETALRAVHDVFNRGKIPFVVGGTGFYYMSLKTVPFSAPSDPAVRTYLSELSKDERRSMLQLKDPEVLVHEGEITRAGKIHPNDDYRITRALEVFLTTGILWSEHWRLRNEEQKSSEFLFTGWYIDVDLEEYKKRLLLRAQQMLDLGFLEEAMSVKKKYGSDCRGLRSLGYREALEVNSGGISKTDFVELLADLHYQYGRKQRTWFKREKELAGITAENLPNILDDLP